MRVFFLHLHPQTKKTKTNMKKLTIIAVCLLIATTMFAQEKKVAFTYDVSFGKSTAYNMVGGLDIERYHITSFPNSLNYKMGAGIRLKDKLTFKIDYFHTANTYYFTTQPYEQRIDAGQRIENLDYIGISAAYSYKMGNSFELSPYLGIGVIMEKSENLYSQSNTIIGRLNSKFATELGLSLEYKATKNLSFWMNFLEMEYDSNTQSLNTTILLNNFVLPISIES